ncbi:MAG: hypothetical protein CME20_16240 [Gemmatimonadetes bacterium]|nr:hypothetical protein [Gemmatimonadota bacterium]
MSGPIGQWLRVLRPLCRTAGNLWRRRVARPPRGGTPGVRPALVFDGAGTHRCVACHLCESACPADCLDITAVPGDEPGVKQPGVAALEAGRCLSCGLCLEACPAGALEWRAQGSATGGLRVDLAVGSTAVA